MAWNRVLTIDDPLQCRTVLANADFEILPTAKGIFQADFTQVGLNRIWLSRYRLSLPQVSSLNLGSRKTFGFLTEPSLLRYCGTEISVGDIIIQKPDAAHHGVAERTLRAACEEHLGMGPIRFLALRRMHLVRRALLHAHPSEATVTRIATDQGFWELGRFSVAYRALFGESPSETLRRPAEKIAICLNRPSSFAASVRASEIL